MAAAYKSRDGSVASTNFGNTSPLVHSSYESVDLIFSVTSIPTFHEVDRFLLHATPRRGQLEGPKEVVHNFEVLANSVNFMDHIFHADDAKLT